MNNALIGKTFDIDLCSLYKHFGNVETKCYYYVDTQFNYCIEYFRCESEEYFDLRKHNPNVLYVYDGETCKVTDVGENCVTIECLENENRIPFLLSWEEFFICANGLMNSISDELQDYLVNCNCNTVEDFCGFILDNMTKEEAVYQVMLQMPDDVILEYYNEFFGK